MLLEQLDTLSGQLGLGVNLICSLDEGFFSSRGLQVISEETSAFGDDCGGFFVFSDSLLEVGVFFDSFSIKLISGLVVSSEFSCLGIDDSLIDFLSGIEISFEFGFKDDSLSVAISQILVESTNVLLKMNENFCFFILRCMNSRSLYLFHHLPFARQCIWFQDHQGCRGVSQEVLRPRVVKRRYQGVFYQI